MAPRNSLRDVPIFLSHPTPHVVRQTFPNVRAKVEAIRLLAFDLDQNQRARALFDEQWPRRSVSARELHQWRAEHLDFVAEPEQILQCPDHFLIRRHGDCTAHAALGALFATMAGWDVALPTMGGERHDPDHLSLLISRPVDRARRAVPPGWIAWGDASRPIPGWIWSDTSTPAGAAEPLPFGQAPGALRV